MCVFRKDCKGFSKDSRECGYQTVNSKVVVVLMVVGRGQGKLQPNVLLSN